MMPAEELSSLIRRLEDPDPSERRAAAEALADGDERAVYHLIQALRDENPGVQDAAMRALIAVGGEPTAHMVIPLLRENAFLRNTAVIILKQIGAPAVPLLRPLFGDKDDDVRKFALDLISDIGQCGYPKEIVRMLEADPNPNVRAAAAQAIGVLGYREGLSALVAALKDEEWVCFMALEALATLNDESTLDPIGQIPATASEAVRCAAIETLGKMGSPRASGILLSRLPQATDLEKPAIVKSLVQVGITPAMAEAADLLRGMLQNGDWDDRLIALRGLVDLRHEQSIPLILETAGSLDPSEPQSDERLQTIKFGLMKFGCSERLLASLSDPSLRFRARVIAAEVIGELRCPRAVPELIGLMNNSVRDVRRACARALADMPTDETQQLLRGAVDDHDGHVRRAAVNALGTIGDKQSVEPILQLIEIERYRDVQEDAVKAALAIDASMVAGRLTAAAPAVRELVARHCRDKNVLLTLSCDADARVKASAIVSLGRFRDHDASARLAEAALDPDPDVRKAAVRSLGNLGCCQQEIQTALRDGDPWVRVAAIKALTDSGADDALSLLGPLLADAAVPVVLSAVGAVASIGGRDAWNLLDPLRTHCEQAVREEVARMLEQVC